MNTTATALTSTTRSLPRPLPRPLSKDWQIGDAYTDPRSRTRWIIRTLSRETGDVELEATNTPTGVWWRTTIDKLPQKGTAS